MILVDNAPAPLFIAEHVSVIATQFFFWFDAKPQRRSGPYSAVRHG
jgi:hypothetical protein